jgi:hypothetical protein
MSDHADATLAIGVIGGVNVPSDDILLPLTMETVFVGAFPVIANVLITHSPRRTIHVAHYCINLHPFVRMGNSLATIQNLTSHQTPRCSARKLDPAGCHAHNVHILNYPLDPISYPGELCSQEDLPTVQCACSNCGRHDGITYQCKRL